MSARPPAFEKLYFLYRPTTSQRPLWPLRRPRLSLALTLLLSFLTACALADMPTPPPAPITPCPCVEPSPLPPPTISGTCDRPLDLERWLQRATRLRQDIAAALAAAQNVAAPEAAAQVFALQDLQRAVLNLSPPECAALAHRFLLDAATTTLTALQNRQFGLTANLDEALQSAQTQLAAFDMLSARLLRRLEAAYTTPTQ